MSRPLPLTATRHERLSKDSFTIHRIDALWILFNENLAGLREENVGHADRVCISALDVYVLPIWKIRAIGASYNKYILAD